ncbi:MAG: glycosyl hydrolase [Rhodothermales bacterium]|nr:glycosyl hydrolase [Rhodothermales bacterium]
MKFYNPYVLAVAVAALLIPLSGNAQPAEFDTTLYNSLEFRNIGPFRGGRSAAVTGVTGNPFTYYFGSTGGGVWKTKDGGQTWFNVSDGFFGGSIGAVAVSEWDPNVVYAGGGEKTVRGNVSFGYGMWKSTDAGRNWKNIGLNDSRHISRIRIHPRDPDRIYVAAMGHLFGPNEERGIYRSSDGGLSWERVHSISNEVGAVDLTFDPTNPRILYASMWRVKRTPYSLESGGEGSSLWKSVDGGDTWEELSDNKGMPSGTLGIIGVTVSPANPDRVWAIVEAEEGGLFRSDNGGKTWSLINDDRSLRQRAWYYSRIYADPQNEDRIYALNVRFWKSNDGGKSFESISTPHGDHHDLWIDPDNPDRMVVGDDGGAQVTLDGGEGWTTYHNQPTAQFYRVTTDNSFPYRILAAQQDNSTVRIAHRSFGSTIGERDWESTAGGESGHIAPHPENPEIVYGGSYGGYLTRLNHDTREQRSINVWPDNPMGYGAGALKYRFQWNFPIFFSPHDSEVLFTAGNVLFKTENEGQSWTQISPDLTRADSSTLGSSGGPITKDNTSVEYYATIFAAAESHHEQGVIWTGSDDGMIHITRNGGETWEDVTPSTRIMPEWMQINSIDVHPDKPGGLYVAGTRYKLDDYAPYLYKTEDYGKSWTKITKGIEGDHFTRVIRADPDREGLLYAGTETGLYVSFDDGQNWESFQRNLPVVPITDIAIKNKDLIVATQGRSLWVMDDLSPLHQLGQEVATSSVWLYEPRDTYRISGRSQSPSLLAGQNPPNGVYIDYYFSSQPDSADTFLKILDSSGEVITTFSPGADETSEQMPSAVGTNRFVWDMQYPAAEKFDGMILWGSGGLRGPKAVPGNYSARLVAVGDSLETEFDILVNPMSEATVEDMIAQFDFRMQIRAKLTETHASIAELRSVRDEIKSTIDRAESSEMHDEIKTAGDDIVERLSDAEKLLYQTKNRSRQDPLNYPIKLNDKLSGLSGTAASGDFRPTDQMVEVRDALVAEIDAALETIEELLTQDLEEFNNLVRRADVPAVRRNNDKIES